jgi:apolipoprotein N-acyltransferase
MATSIVTTAEKWNTKIQPDFTSSSEGNHDRKRPLPSNWLWFCVGCILLLFSYGVNNIALAAWLSPVFLLHFVRRQKWQVWMPLLLLAQIAGSAFQMRGMIPVLGTAFYVSLIIGGFQSLIPFAADAWLAGRIGGIASTLVFPCTWTALDYLTSLGSFGSWGAAGYSQYGELALLQILSVTGLWGLTFLIGWFASASNYLWDEGYVSKPARHAACLCLATVAAVILLGGMRLSFFPPSSETVRIASLSRRPTAEPGGQLIDHILANQATTGELTEFRNWAERVNDDLLLRADREAQAGAKIVFWAEGNGLVLKQDEAALLAKGSELAAKDHIYLGLAIGVLNPGQNKPLENKLVVAGPDGKIEMNYYKAHPVPGEEEAISVTNDGRLQVMETGFGHISAVICFDGDFPQLLAQAGALNSDLVLDPSNDWQAIDPWHTEMASLRAIEQGVNLDRQTSHGLSAAFDYQGRTLAAMDHFHSSDYAMVADVPTRGVRTIYSKFGDWFAWLTIVGSLALIAAAFSPLWSKKWMRTADASVVDAHAPGGYRVVAQREMERRRSSIVKDSTFCGPDF